MKTVDAAEFSDSDFNAADEADMAIVVNGKITTWIWTFAGPGHPKTVDQSNRIARERLHRDRQQEQARVNGKKWVAPEETVDETRARNVQQIVERLIRWSPVKINGEDYPFTPENATKLLSDHAKVGLYIQSLEFLAADNSFTPRSETK
jgi:hypothetical protein